MKAIRFLFVGQAKKTEYKALEEFYLSRVQNLHPATELVFVKDRSDKDLNVRIEKESQEIEKLLNPKEWNVICDERGKSMNSVQFSSQVENLLDTHSRINFVIGGAYGMSDRLKSGANQKIKLSEFTMPHELARVVLLEQVYRSLSISGNRNYHH